MPGVGRYPCTSCHYVANNRRMLARHSALIHCDKVFKCPVCPFITRYAANWYRHKRDQHGLSKLTTCDTCGFSANSPPELAQHREAEHPDVLQLEKYEDKYAKEKQRLSEGSGIKTPDIVGVEKDLKNESDLLLDIYDIDQEIDINLPPNGDDVNDESVKFAPTFNGHFSSDFVEGDSGRISKESSPEVDFDMNDMDSSSDNLRPLRIRRSYNCDQCGLLTNNPREYLYHLRNIHGEKIAVHECKYCIYASKHIQKLQRHCNLVHRQQLEKDTDYKRLLETSKDKKVRPDLMTMGMPLNHPPPSETFQNSGMVAPAKLPIRSKPQTNFFKCNICTYQTRNKALMFHHEKTAHMKKKNFRCTECGYVTNDKSRFAKHIKYHNLPKLQCQYCFFKTAYKWNMERHMKNHEIGAEGDFHCNECSFTTSTKQSYNAHITNHHDPCAEDMDDHDIHEVNGEEDSNEWEDISMQENEDDINEGGDNNFDSYEFSEATENPEATWKQGKPYERNLKCQQCDFRAAWPFELKKHEENHRSQKKHPCPLCGMRFEHIAWLTKHLRRIHGENSQAKNIAAAFDLLKPARRRPGKEYAADAVLPMFQEVLKQQQQQQNNVSNNTSKNTDSSKSSMLSTLLKKPLHSYAPSSVSKSSASFKSKAFNQTSNLYKQPRISSYYQKTSGQQESSDTANISSKKVPTCNVCGYKTRWISELQRHMRVHSQEKPFQCHKCKYVCKWKGDLNRHLMKYHGIKIPPKRSDFPKFAKKSEDSLDSSNDWQTTGAAKRNLFPSGAPGRSSQDSPLDLTLGRETFPHPNAASPYDAYDFDSHLAMDGESDPLDIMSVDSSPVMYNEYKSQISQSNGSPLSSDSPLPNPKLKYQCPLCTFSTTTASRFHVHIVQHYNKRPFMCSVCGYNSNWEWDITKHIRLKGCRDKDLNKACVLLTDESGRRNYDKYERYLVDITQPIPVGFPSRLPELNGPQESSSKFSMPKQLDYNEPSNKSCSYDFRNIGSNFEDSPVNIVVTPDINLPDAQENQEVQDGYLNDMPEPMDNENPANPNEAKYFYCKHCNFKHSTKRVVVSHLSSHAGLKPFRCRACGMVSNWRHVIVRHVKDVHNGYMNEVEERINFVQEGYSLRLVSVSEGSAESNVDPDKSPQLYGCKICPYKCDKEFYMNFHMKQHRPREGAIFKCDYCPYFVKFKKTLVRHMKLHEPNPPESDNMNGNSDYQSAQNPPQQYSNDIYDFYDSQQNESNDESIAISFNQLSQVDPGDTSPQKIKRHVCEHCPYKTDNKTQYLYHKQFHRPNPSAPFKCSDCSYWATMQHLLTQHMKVHSENDTEQNDSPKNNGPRQFFEFFDDRNVPEKISIIYVKKGEENVKMFKCEFCPMMNKKKANVRVHQKMHGVVVNDGKFACMYCNYQCLNQGGLTNHMKVHQKPGDREFSPKKFYESGYDEDGFPIRKRTNSYFCYKCPAIFKTANDLQSHSKFHGSTLPLKCTYCDYRVKQKPHITQHLNVHTAEYKAKRKASQPLNAASSAEPVVETTAENTEIVPFKKIDQMLLLEASELKAALNKSGEAAKNLHKCVFCPASFCKTAILVYHVSLHGSDGEFKCTQCDYAVNRAENLTIHNKVHPKRSPKKPLRSFPCPKCPAVFYKQDRHERHLELHGKNYRFACDQCDYSVRFAANLIKHKNVHIAHPDFVRVDDPTHPNDILHQSPQDQAPLAETTNFYNTVDEKKVTYICDRCPYNQTRRDAVQSHQRRHWIKDGFECPYCDYSSMQNSFLQNHIKLHVQPNNLFPPQAFMKFQSFKIYVRDENEETLIFDDEEMVNQPNDSSDKPQESEDLQEKTDVSKNVAEVEIEKIVEVETILEDANLAVPVKSPKFFIEKSESFHTDSNLSSSSSKSNKVPIVVLSDIYANDKDLKKWGNRLKIPKLKISRKYTRSSSSERSSKRLKAPEPTHAEESAKTKKSKPSLVVKIKVENCRRNKHEKTLYSVSTKSSDEQPMKDPENSLGSAENTNDTAASDVVFQDSETSLPTATSISPVDDVEENTLTSNPEMDDGLKASDSSVGDMVDSVVESATDSVLPRPSAETIDLKSNDSFSNDTVPVVSDILCDKLDCLTELSFKDSDLSLTNGDCSNHLPSSGLNLLPEEIKVGL